MRSFLRRTRESLALGALLVAACSGGEDSSGTARPLGPAPAGQYAVRLEVRSDTLPYGESRQYAAQVSDAKGTPMAASVTWTSTDPAVVTVDGGVATAVGFGVAGIVARYGAAADTATLVVSSAGLSLQLSPSAVAASAGDTVAFAARIVTAAGASLAIEQVQWASSDPSAAELLGDGRVVLRGEGDVTVLASIDKLTASAPIKVRAASVGSIAISPASSSTIVGGSVKLTAVVTEHNGRIVSDPVVSWTTSNASVATVDPDGLVRGVSRGGVMVTASSGGKSATASVNVASQPAASLTLALNPDTVVPGHEMQADAVPRDASGAPIAGRLIAYQSSNPAVATVRNTGVIVPLVPGITRISAICDGHVATVELTVEMPRVTSVTIVPGAPVLAAGTTVPLAAMVTDQVGDDVPGAGVAWTSGTPLVATISAGGLLTGHASGSSLISATAGGVTGRVTATVNSQTVASVRVTPAAATVPAGATVSLSASALDAAGQTITGAAFGWTTSDAAVATVSALGVVTGRMAGSAVISAASGGRSAAAVVTVTTPPPVAVASVSVTVNTTTLAVGQATQAVATVYDAQGNVLSGRPVTWTSADAAVASVSAGGLITATGGGSVSISATAGGQAGFAAISVTAPPPPPPAAVATVSVTAPVSALLVGQTSQLTVTLRDAQGNVLTGRTLLFSSSNTTIATVSPSGLVTAKGGGAATITVTSEGVSGGKGFNVTSPPPPTLTALVLSPGSVSLTVGATAQFAVAGTWSDGSTAVPAVTYSATGGTITAGGLYTAGATPGAYRVIATQQGGTRADTSSVMIAAPVATLLQLILTPASVTVAPGGTAQFSVSGVWSDGSSTVPAVTYSATGGTISAGGLYAAGTTAGTYRVIATQVGGGKADTAVVTLVPEPQPSGPSGAWRLIFEDNFTGVALDTMKWHRAAPWAPAVFNQELQTYSPQNVQLANGTLRLQADHSFGQTGDVYTSGMIASWDKFSFMYGVAEARAKIPAGKGLWPAFWLLPATTNVWPPEIDVLETVGSLPQTVFTSIHWGTPSAPQSAGSVWSGPDFSAGWHTFTVEWTSESVTWYIDGVERWRYSNPANIPNQSLYLLATLAIGGTMPGNPDASTSFPALFELDYIRVWQR